MHFQFFTMFFLILSCGSSYLHAAALPESELKALQQKMKSASQLSVDFDQTKISTLRPNKPSRSEGHAAFAKPARFRWELLKPEGETLIYDGATLYSLNAKEKIATKYNASADRSVEINEVIGVVLDFDAMQKKYTLDESSKDGTTILLKLKPNKGASSSIASIDVRIDSATASIKGVKLFLTNKNTSEFSFSNPDRSALPAKTFEIPKDFKIVNGI